MKVLKSFCSKDIRTVFWTGVGLFFLNPDPEKSAQKLNVRVHFLEILFRTLKTNFLGQVPQKSNQRT